MPLIRGETSYRPINGEKVTIDLRIIRFNFGWIQKQRFVGDGGEGDGVLIESSTVSVAGDPNIYTENVYLKGLPAQLECPGNLSPSGSCILDSYKKVGSLTRVSPMVNISGQAPSMYSMGTVGYGVVEQKGYAGAISRGGPAGGGNPPGMVVDMVSVSANGVETVTIASG